MSQGYFGKIFLLALMPIKRYIPCMSLFSVKIQGILWFLLSCLCFAVMSVQIKHLSSLGAGAFSMMFMRLVFAVLIMLPFAWKKNKAGSLRLDNRKSFMWRSIIGFVGMILCFYAIILLPVNTFVALSFMIPIFASIGAVIFLDEKMGAHRWGAVFVGFLGMLIIVQPAQMHLGLGLVVCLFFCLTTAAVLVIVKRLSASEDTFSMMFFLHLWMGYMSLPFIFICYDEINWQTIPWGVAIAVVSIAAHYGLVKSYTLIDLTLTSPFEFSRIIMASGMAYVFLHEVPHKESYIGAALIVASTAYIAHREMKRKSN